MPLETVRKKFYQKELEVSALLEITQAVNNNLPENDLYKIYEFTLRANLHIDKLALYVKEEDWECKVQFGTEKNFDEVSLDEYVLSQKEIMRIDPEELNTCEFEEFEILVPVMHKSRLLAFVFIKASNITEVGDTHFIQALSNIMLVAIENKRLARKQLEQQAFQRDMEIAKNVQQYLFPKNLPKTDKVEVEAFYQPCKTVGGDYYDYIDLHEDNQFLVCIADVSGKGIPAAILMSNFQAVLRTLSRTSKSPEEVVEQLNHQLVENASRENFITFFMAVYDYGTRQLRYINCGHNHPILFDSKGDLRKLTCGTTILGAFEELPFLNTGSIDDLDQFSLFLFTDGVTENFNEDGDEFGTEGLEELLSEHLDHSLSEIHAKLIERLGDFMSKKAFMDDLTFLSCRVNNVPS